MKKIISALLVAGTFAGANAAEGAKISSGAYAGLTFNAATTKFDLNDTVLGNGKKSTHSRAANLGVVLGYGMVSSQVYYGAELFFITNNQKKTVENLKAPATFGFLEDNLVVKRSNIFGIAPRLGFLVNPCTMIYVRVGAEYSKFKATFAGKKIQKSLWTFAPGLGFERAVANNVTVRAEYAYSLKKDLSKKDSTFDLKNIKTDGHRFTLGIAYRF